MRLKEHLKNKHKRIMLFAHLSVPLNAALAIGKIILGIVSGSFFPVVSGLYNIGLGLAKFFAIKTYREVDAGKDLTEADIRQKQNEVYVIIGGILLTTSVVYIIYCINMFLGNNGPQYNQIVAIGIAAVTFAEIAISIRGVILTRKDRKPIQEAVKLTNVASSLISLVLTQSALLSFAQEGDMSFFNGLSGIIFGGFGALIGAYMLIRMTAVVKGKHDEYLLKKVSKTAQTLESGLVFKLLKLDDTHEGPIKMHIESSAKTRDDGKDIKALVLKKHNIELIFN